MPRRPRPEDPNAPEPVCPPYDEPPRYIFVRSARTFAHGIMKQAVLRRVLGNIDFRDEPSVLARYLTRVRRRWIDLATGYSDPYLPANEFVRARFQALLDCRPPFAYVMPGGHKYCNIPIICPSCWAREAVATCSPLDRGLFGEAPEPGVRPAGVTMLVRRQQYRFWRVPVRSDGEEIDPESYVPLASFLDHVRPADRIYSTGVSAPMMERHLGHRCPRSCRSGSSDPVDRGDNVTFIPRGAAGRGTGSPVPGQTLLPG